MTEKEKKARAAYIVAELEKYIPMPPVRWNRAATRGGFLSWAGSLRSVPTRE